LEYFDGVGVPEDESFRAVALVLASFGSFVKKALPSGKDGRAF
jgi:hypothetical protein